MIDDTDVDFAAWAFDPRTPFGVALWVSLLLALGIAVAINHSDCDKVTCAHGVPKLTDHQCLCVEEPAP